MTTMPGPTHCLFFTLQRLLQGHSRFIRVNFICLDNCLNYHDRTDSWWWWRWWWWRRIHFWDRISQSSSGCPRAHSADQAGLKLIKTHLPLPLKYWDQRCLPLHLSWFLLRRHLKVVHSTATSLHVVQDRAQQIPALTLSLMTQFF